MTKDKDQDNYDAGSNPPNKVLYIHMAPFGLNSVVGKDMENLLGFGRSIWKAATAAERERISEVLRSTGAEIPMPESKGTVGSAIIAGISMALCIVEFDPTDKINSGE